MHFEDFKTWHWAIIGLLVGALFSGVKMWQGPWFNTADVDTVDQLRFEHALVGKPEGGTRMNAQMTRYLVGRQLVKDLVVHPPDPGDPNGSYWVTGKICGMQQMNQVPDDPKTPVVPAEVWRPFKYPADAPYQELPPNVQRPPSRAALMAATRATTRAAAAAAKKKNSAAAAAAATQPTAAAATPIPPIKSHHNVVEYLQSMQDDPNAHFTYRYAWQENKLAMAVLPPVAGLLIIGIAWPMTLGLMQGAGLARKPQPRAKLPKARKLAAKAAVVDHSAGDKQLADMNAAMEAAMAGFIGANITDDPDESRAGMQVVKPLAGGDLVAGQKAGDDEVDVKEFGGEFYPVVRSVHKEHKHEDEPATANVTVAEPPTAKQPAKKK